jgi:hypothetical protein
MTYYMQFTIQILFIYSLKKLNIMKYLNIKSNYGIETIDQLDPKDFKTRKEFYMELNRLVREYRLAGMFVYISQRCNKTWNWK